MGIRGIVSLIESEFEEIIDRLESNDINEICDVMVQIISHEYFLHSDKAGAVWILIMLSDKLVHAASYLKTKHSIIRLLIDQFKITQN